ncbi:MAG: ribosome maturation factor RimP [Desulfobacteraceae bacterium]|nr:MAG: ribosome maturation factor RimP [Desulfobacteraceae bacterium]
MKLSGCRNQKYKLADKTKAAEKKPAREEKRPRVSDAEIAARVAQLAEPLCRDQEVELVHIEYQREAGGRILRLYIDKPGGVMLSDCAEISRQMGDLLDVYLDEIGPYNLEVSSPGSDRPLGKESDFERFRGCKAKIRTLHLLDGRKNFTGIILGVVQGCVRLQVDNKTVDIPLEEIHKARLNNYSGESPCL